VLTEGTAFDNFLDDIEIINKAACNVTFGIGGPLSITSAFSKNNIACIPFINTTPFNNSARLIHNNICETIQDLRNQLDRYTNPIFILCQTYNITPFYDNTLIGDAMGIGDILFRILCIKNGLINKPFNINLTYFTKEYYKTEPLTQLKFRLQLIKDLLKANHISNSMVQFVFTNSMLVNTIMPYDSINRFNLNIELEPIHTSAEYIIFHTKCRHFNTENYEDLKNKISNFCKTFKSRYTIIIMGERTFPFTEEVAAHGITTVYTELENLKVYNDVSDITIENIYSNLDYDHYKKDVSIIKNAKYNISFGIGGQLCTSLLFGKSTIYYSTLKVLNKDYLTTNNHFLCDSKQSFFDKIQELCGM
jgi:hypothetical protein